MDDQPRMLEHLVQAQSQPGLLLEQLWVHKGVRREIYIRSLN